MRTPSEFLSKLVTTPLNIDKLRGRSIISHAAHKLLSLRHGLTRMKHGSKDWLLGGLTERSKSCCYWRGVGMDRDTRRGRALYWLLEFDWSVRSGPSHFRWWLADQLMRAAMRLRREKVSIFGYYDSQKGNRAAALCDSVDWDLVLHHAADDLDELWDKRAVLAELASLAGATWVRNSEPPIRTVTDAEQRRPGFPNPRPSAAAKPPVPGPTKCPRPGVTL